MIYSGNLHKELRDWLINKVTLEKSMSYDDFGEPIIGESITNIPALWIQIKEKVVDSSNTKVIYVSKLKVLLPPDLTPKNGEILVNEESGEKLKIGKVRFNTAYCPTIPITVWGDPV